MRRFWTIFSVLMVIVFLVTGILLVSGFLFLHTGIDWAIGQATPTPISTPTSGVGSIATPTGATGSAEVETMPPYMRPIVTADSGNPLGLPVPVITGLFIVSSISTLFNAGRAVWRFGVAIGRRFQQALTVTRQ